MALIPIPWPSTTSAATLKAARNALRRELKGTESVDANPDSDPPVAAVAGVPPDDVIDRLALSAIELVQRYAPGAPLPIREEAVIRCAAYLFHKVPRAVQVIRTGSMTLDFREGSDRLGNPIASALRHSGAAAILSPWKVRRARKVEADT